MEKKRLVVEFDPPPHGTVSWECRWQGDKVGVTVIVEAQTHYFARQKAAAKLGVDPMQIEAKQMENEND